MSRKQEKIEEALSDIYADIQEGGSYAQHRPRIVALHAALQSLRALPAAQSEGEGG